MLQKFEGESSGVIRYVGIRTQNATVTVWTPCRLSQRCHFASAVLFISLHRFCDFGKIAIVLIDSNRYCLIFCEFFRFSLKNQIDTGKRLERTWKIYPFHIDFVLNSFLFIHSDCYISGDLFDLCKSVVRVAKVKERKGFESSVRGFQSHITPKVVLWNLQVPFFVNLILSCAFAFKCTIHVTFCGPAGTSEVTGPRWSQIV